jgi:hypothetical protein
MNARVFFPNFLLIFALMLASTSYANESGYILGFGTGGELQEVTAPWTYKVDSLSSFLDFDTYVRSNTGNALVKASFYPSGGWQPRSQSSTLEIKYEQLALLWFHANRAEPFQDLDNMSVTPPAVQPATLLLLGAGLVGLSRLGRKMLRITKSERFIVLEGGVTQNPLFSFKRR